MEAVVVVALWLFALTHVDTLVLLVAFLADERYHLTEVLLGHYTGFSLGLIAALVLAVLVAGTLQEYSYLLGVVPLSLGLWAFYRRRPNRDSTPGDSPANQVTDSPPSRSVDRGSTQNWRSRIWLTRVSIVTVAGIGLSGENIAVFVPFFLTLSRPELVVVSVIYLVATGVLFLVALVSVRRTPLAALPDWVGQLAVPAVLTGVGLYVLVAGWLAA